MARRTRDVATNAQRPSSPRRVSKPAAEQYPDRGAADPVAAIRRCVAETLEHRLLFATFTVLNTNNDGAGSFRQAIIDANTSLGVDTIEFAIGAGPQSIQPTSQLPAIDDPVIIDATTQPGFDPDTSFPIVELNGSGSGIGLRITDGNSTVRGLAITDWDTGIEISNVGGNTIVGNFIGVDLTGVDEDANATDGIRLLVGDNNIGTTADGSFDPVTDFNVISSNGDDGIDVRSGGNIIQNNLIGTDATGQGDLGNGDHGIEINHDPDELGNVIGGFQEDDPEFGNVIAFSGSDGIAILNGSGNAILGNSITENGDLGIDLDDDGVDGVDDLDPDTGPNDLMNRPIISGIPNVGVTTVNGFVNSLPNATFRVEFFSDFDPDNDAGEGQIFLDAVDVTTDADGKGFFSAQLPVFVPAGRAISATSTLMEGGVPVSTSEFSFHVDAGETPGIDVEDGDGDDVPINGTPDPANQTDFQTQDLDEGPDENFFVITNTGSSILNLTGTPRIQITGPNAGDFTVGEVPAGSLDPGETTGFSILFDTSTPGPKTATVTIPNTDDDENPYTFTITGTGTQKNVSIADATIIEGNAGTTNLQFTVTLSSVSTQDVSVLFSTVSGTATAGTDFQTTSGTAIIPAGSLTATVSVPVIGDTTFELDETFTVAIVSTGDVIVSDGTGTGTIQNDDAAPIAGIGDVSQAEGQAGSSQFVFTFNIPAPSTLPVTVSYSTADGTATAGVDYLPASGVLTIPVGQTTVTVPVTVLGDRNVEADETFFVNLSSAQGVTLGDSQAVGTIVNDDRTFTFTGGGTVQEAPGGTVATFTISLDAPSTESIEVNFSTQNGTATAPADYTPVGGKLIFAPGETSKTINVPVAADTLDEGDENFFLTLANPVNAGLTSGSQGEVTIVDSTLLFLAFDAKTPVSYIDSTGDTVTVTLRGPGQAHVQFSDDSGNADAQGIVVDGTSAGSALVINATGGGTTVGGINVNRSIKTIDGRNVDLTGSATVRGTLRQMFLRDVRGNDGTLTVQARGAVNKLQFNNVSDWNITGSSKVKTIIVNSWADTLPGVDTIRVPGLQSLISAGDFAADVRTGTLTTTVVNGTLIGSDIRATVGIRALTAGAIRDSNVFVGVAEDFVGLPEDDDDYFNDAGYLNNLKTGVFSNSRIGAPVQKRIDLGQVQTENANITLGVSADRLGTITGQTSRGPLFFNSLDQIRTLNEDDFVIIIYE